MEGDRIYLKVDPKRKLPPTTTKEPSSTTNSNVDDSKTQESNTKTPNIDIEVMFNNNVIDATIPKPESEIEAKDPAEDEFKTTTGLFMNNTNRHNLENDVDVISNDITQEEIYNTNKSDTAKVLSDYKKPKVETTSTATTSTTTTTTTATTTTNTAILKTNDMNSINSQYDEEEIDESYEDFAVEWHERTTLVRKNKVRVHISNEITTARGLPLRQGFIASTGYPNFYVGESNCSWTITAPVGHRIRLTVLDIHLRGNFWFCVKY